MSTAPHRSGEPRRAPPTIFRNVIVICGALLAYLGVRAAANAVPGAAHGNAQAILLFERSLGIDLERGFQAVILSRPLLEDFFNLVYAWTYWPTVVTAFIYTWRRRRDLFVAYRDALCLSGAIGLVVFLVFPVAPPRFVTGYVDTVRDAGRAQLFAHPSFLINEFAALPSYHVGWVTLACVVAALATSKRAWRPLFIAPPLLMAAAVVATGNHYLVDIVAGVGISLAALAIVRRANRILPGPPSPAARAPSRAPAPVLRTHPEVNSASLRR